MRGNFQVRFLGEGRRGNTFPLPDSLLGGRTREGALAYTHCGGEDFQQVEDEVRAALEKGFKAVRVQVAIPGNIGTYGTAPGRSTVMGSTRPDMPYVEQWEPAPYLRTIPRLLDHLRAALGEEVELLHDVHERLNPVQASRLAQELEPYHLFFLEDPLRPEHRESFRLIRQHTTTPIAMGELFHTRWEALPLITEQLIDYIRCDLGHIGGLTEARKIAAIAETYHVQTAWHGPGDIAPMTHAANVHLDLAIPNFGIQEMVFFPEVMREVITGGPTCENGYMLVSDAPGLGTDVNETLAAKYPYERAYLPMVRRFDGSVHDW